MQYRLLKDVLFRAPAFGWSDVEPYIESKNFRDLLKQRDICLALMAASPGFFLRLRHKIEKNSLTENDKQKILRYLMRMSTRSTPFGLLAGIGVATLQERRSADLRQRKKIGKFFASPLVSHGAYNPIDNPVGDSAGNQGGAKYLIINPSLILFDDIARYYDSTSKLTRAILPKAAIRIIKKFNSRFLVKDAIHFISEGKGDLRNEASVLISSLIQAGILLRCDRTPLMETRFTESIPMNEESLTKLYRKCENSQKGDPLPWIAFTTFLDSRLPVSTKDAEQVLATCEKLMPVFSPLRIQRRALLCEKLKAFLTKNSPDAAVPILAITASSLLSTEIEDSSGRKTSEIKTYLHRKLASFTKSGKYIWSVSPEDVQEMRRLVSGVPKGHLPNAFSVLVHVIETEIGLQFLVSDQVTSGSAAGMHSRFAPASEKVAALVEEIQDFERAAESDAIVADLEYTPQKGSDANAMLRKSFSKYFVDFSGFVSEEKERVPLSDIAVFLDHRGDIKFISMQRQREIIFGITQQYNEARAGNFHYMLMASCARNRSEMSIWDWHDDENIFHFYPRVTLGPVVLRSARWVVRSRQQLSELPLATLWVNGSDRLPVDVEMRNFIVDQAFKENKSVVFEEVIQRLPSNDFEVVLTAFKKGDAKSVPLLKDYLIEPNEKSASQFIVSGQNALYFKIYCDFSDFTSVLNKISTAIGSEKRTWFFTKFRKSDCHLRVRVVQIDPIERDRILGRILQLLRKMMGNHLVYRFEQCSSAREISRYGGLSGVLFCERLSHYDSIFNLNLISRLRKRDMDASLVASSAMAVLIVEFWLHFFVNDRVAERQFCDQRILDRRTASRHWKADPKIEHIFTLSKLPSADQLQNEFLDLSKNWTAPVKFRFISSFIHMSLNRWISPIGSDEEEEIFAGVRSLYRERYELDGSKKSTV